MRLIFDLFPTQSESRYRGIGRFTLSLAKAMAAQAGGRDLRLLANGLYPDSAEQFRTEFAGLVAPGAYACYTHLPLDPRNTDDLHQEQLASALVHTAYQAIGADVVLCASPFEGWCERGVVPQAAGRLPAGLKVAVLHDLIPWLFPEQHLDPVPDYKQWYTRRLAALGQYDLLLANSEATRADAIRLLGLTPERVVNIFAAADTTFRQLPPDALSATDLDRFGIDRPFVLYTGNSDYRKNLAGMLSAFARLPRAVRDTHQLVVNQVGHVEMFMLQVAAAGLARDSVVVTGRISDDELRALYNRCKVFVFPSLYEGFGLPVLEAMACGAPVIAGDNSSIPEVVGRSDSLFDASSPEDISVKLLRTLTDDAWRAELSAHGLAHATRFSWDKTAAAAWQAIDTALAAQRAALANPLQHGAPRLRIAAVVPLPEGPARKRALRLVHALSPYADVALVDDTVFPDAAQKTLSRGDLARQWNRFDTMLYIAQHDTLAPDLVTLIRSAPGVLLLLGGLDTATCAGLPGNAAEASQLLRDEGLQGLVARHRNAANRTGSAMPLGRSLLEALRCLVLEEKGTATLLQQTCAPGTLPALAVLGAADEQERARHLAAALRMGADRSWRAAAAHVAAAWRSGRCDESVLDEAAQYAERNLRLNRSGRILVDATRLGPGAGAEPIASSLRDLVHDMCNCAEAATPIELVRVDEGKLYRASAAASALFAIDSGAFPAEQIDIQPGDVLFMPDADWGRHQLFLPVFEAVRQFGGRIVASAPPLAGPAGTVAAGNTDADRLHEEFAAAVRHSDLLLCLSQAEGAAIQQRIAEHRLEHAAGLRILPWQGSAASALALLRASFD
ncbi:glycosyltransferase family 4 protein [Telluria sp. B2]